MKNGIHELYNLENGYIILPSDLIANAKLPNYEHVKFYSNQSGLVVECLCILDDGDKVTFTYYFNSEDKLQRLISEDGMSIEVIFDRRTQSEKLRKRISKAVFEASR
ncbi:MAG: hypothetical protein K0R57_6601 [Paenibacillaceae bacterium]|jgi:hypothetical protein|nr:hypothetical protein [Paenibacillaceae bacterium]